MCCIINIPLERAFVLTVRAVILFDVFFILQQSKMCCGVSIRMESHHVDTVEEYINSRLTK